MTDYVHCSTTSHTSQYFTSRPLVPSFSLQSDGSVPFGSPTLTVHDVRETEGTFTRSDVTKDVLPSTGSTKFPGWRGPGPTPPRPYV